MTEPKGPWFVWYILPQEQRTFVHDANPFDDYWKAWKAAGAMKLANPGTIYFVHAYPSTFREEVAIWQAMTHDRY